MSNRNLERTLRQLRNRTDQLSRAPVALVPSLARQLLAWLDNRPTLLAALAPLSDAERRYSAQIADSLNIGEKYASPFYAQETAPPLEPANPDEAAALGLASLRLVAKLAPLDSRFETLGDEDVNRIRGQYSRLNHYIVGDFPIPGESPFVSGIQRIALPNLVAFIEESVDEHGGVLALLGKYKHRCEWYRRNRLRQLVDDNPESQRNGEDVLTFDLYEYLHDQGHDFTIESRTAEGRPDLLLHQAGGLRVVVDGKLVTTADRARVQLTKGFRQVLDYCQQQSQNTGYLVVFIMDDVKLAVDGDDDHGFGCLRVAGTAIYYVFIDIAVHAKPPSNRPRTRVITISSADVVQPTEESGMSAEGDC